MPTRIPQKLPDNFLQPVIEAFAPTSFGRPKAQAIFNAFIEWFDEMRECGYTYKDIAAALEKGGVRGRTGARFTEQSLANYLVRARANAKSRGTAAASSMPVERRERSEQPPTLTSQPKVVSTDGPAPSRVREFMRKIDEAKAHAATDKILNQRTLKRS